MIATACDCDVLATVSLGMSWTADSLCSAVEDNVSLTTHAEQMMHTTPFTNSLKDFQREYDLVAVPVETIPGFVHGGKTPEVLLACRMLGFRNSPLWGGHRLAMVCHDVESKDRFLIGSGPIEDSWFVLTGGTLFTSRSVWLSPGDKVILEKPRSAVAVTVMPVQNTWNLRSLAKRLLGKE